MVIDSIASQRTWVGQCGAQKKEYGARRQHRANDERPRPAGIVKVDRGECNIQRHGNNNENERRAKGAELGTWQTGIRDFLEIGRGMRPVTRHVKMLAILQIDPQGAPSTKRPAHSMRFCPTITCTSSSSTGGASLDMVKTRKRVEKSSAPQLVDVMIMFKKHVASIVVPARVPRADSRTLALRLVVSTGFMFR